MRGEGERKHLEGVREKLTLVHHKRAGLLRVCVLGAEQEHELCGGTQAARGVAQVQRRNLAGLAVQHVEHLQSEKVG